MTVGWIGAVSYTDAFLEDCNSTQVNQPALILIYVFGLIFCLATLGIGLFLLPFFMRFYLRLVKSGLTVGVRGGEAVYVFCDRNRIDKLNRLVRSLAEAREERLNSVFGAPIVGETADGFQSTGT